MRGKFPECDKQNSTIVKQTRYKIVYHILETFHALTTLWIIQNFACKSESG